MFRHSFLMILVLFGGAVWGCDECPARERSVSLTTLGSEAQTQPASTSPGDWLPAMFREPATAPSLEGENALQAASRIRVGMKMTEVVGIMGLPYSYWLHGPGFLTTSYGAGDGRTLMIEADPGGNVITVRNINERAARDADQRQRLCGPPGIVVGASEAIVRTLLGEPDAEVYDVNGKLAVYSNAQKLESLQVRYDHNGRIISVDRVPIEVRQSTPEEASRLGSALTPGSPKIKVVLPTTSPG